jgi:hypothetical protein
MIVPLAETLGGQLVEPSELADGDVPLHFSGELIGGYRPAGLNGALERLVDIVQRELGVPLHELDRNGKQLAVQRLDDLGAFTLRRAVEDLADRLGVSRFTVYNYLNARTRAPERGSAP